MTPEQQAMLDRARSSLELTRIEIDHGLWNDAVTAGYYAMLHSARAALASFGLSFSSHGATQGAFGRELANPGLLPVHLHRYLINAERARSAATYSYAVEMTEEQARATLQRAEEFVAAIEDFLRDSEA